MPENTEVHSIDDLGWIKKSLVVGLISLLTHFGAGMWWAATQTAKMDFVQQSLIAIRQELKDSSVDRYRASEALKDFSVVNSRLEKNENRIYMLERALARVKGVD